MVSQKTLPYPAGDLRVLYVLDKSGFGGVQSIASTMIERGVPGIELTLFFLRNLNRSYGMSDLVRSDVVYSRSRWKYGFGSFLELLRLVDDRRIDIVHLNGNKSALYGFLLKRLRPRLKIINHDHSGEFDYGGWFARFIKWTAPRYDLFLGVSERRKRFLTSVCAVDPGKVVVLNNFVDEHRFVRPANADSGECGGEARFVLGFVGRLSRIKGCDLLIRALPALVGRIPGLEVRIVGTGPEQSALAGLARELGVDKYVRFCGFVANPAEEYTNFNLMVIPSRAEEGPICLYEAWIMGVPVVASDAPVIDERIRDRHTGLLFPSENSVVLAEKILELYVSKELRARLSANGLEEAKNLTSKNYLEKLAGIYKSL